MAFLMSFPLMFRSKVGEMKFSIPQSLLAERGKGAQGAPATLTPQRSTGQGRGGQSPGGCDLPSGLTGPNPLLPPPATGSGVGLGSVHFGAE